jgi:hypothetical protein
MKTEIHLKAEQVTKFNSRSRERTKSVISAAENKIFRNSQILYIAYRRTGQGPKNFNRTKQTLVTTHDKCHSTIMPVLSNAVSSVRIAITEPKKKNITMQAVDPGGTPFLRSSDS